MISFMFMHHVFLVGWGSGGQGEKRDDDCADKTMVYYKLSLCYAMHGVREGRKEKKDTKETMIQEPKKEDEETGRKPITRVSQ